MKKYTTILTIAGSDSGGGAGIQADLKTFSALGCYGMSAITALTAQNTVGVTGIYPVEPDFVTSQINAILSDIGADAVKIGMLSTSEIIKVVAEALKKHKVSKLVLDPVMMAKSGDKLLQDDAIEALVEYLFPLASVITPNLNEAQILTDLTILTRDDMLKAGQKLLTFGCQSVVVKGSFFRDDNLPDLYICQDSGHLWLESERIDTINNHGTGCTFSAAIAAFMGLDNSVLESVKSAKKYITEAITCGAKYQLGTGKSPVHHFYNLWEK